MKKFTFKDLQNWFGDRGIILRKGHLKKWGNDDRFIYWMPHNKKCDVFFSSEYDRDDTVLYCSWKSIYAEIEDEVMNDKIPNGFLFNR